MGRVSFEEATAALSPQQLGIVRVLHDSMGALGCVCAAAEGTKPDKFKIEYKKGKPARSLLILRVDGAEWSALLKLYHLADYADLLDALTSEVRHELLSRGCGSHGGGCKGPVSVSYGDKELRLCRHAMQIKAMGERDLPTALALLEAEDRYIG